MLPYTPSGMGVAIHGTKNPRFTVIAAAAIVILIALIYIFSEPDASSSAGPGGIHAFGSPINKFRSMVSFSQQQHKMWAARRSIVSRNYERSTADPPCDYEAIVVPGGGSQRGETPETLPLWVRSRLDAAAAVYKRCKKEYLATMEGKMAIGQLRERLVSLTEGAAKGAAAADGDSSSMANDIKAATDEAVDDGRVFLMKIVTLSQGTTHKPNYATAAGWPIHEATAGALYLVRHHNIPRRAVLREDISLDTVGNAYFFRLLFSDPLHWARMLVITSEFHMERTRFIFNWILAAPSRATLGGAGSASNAPYNVYRGSSGGGGGLQVDYLTASDDGTMAERPLQARIAKERRALKELKAKVLPALSGIWPLPAPPTGPAGGPQQEGGRLPSPQRLGSGVTGGLDAAEERHVADLATVEGIHAWLWAYHTAYKTSDWLLHDAGARDRGGRDGGRASAVGSSPASGLERDIVDSY